MATFPVTSRACRMIARRLAAFLSSFLVCHKGLGLAAFTSSGAKNASTLTSPALTRFSVQHAETVFLGRAGGSQSGSQRAQSTGDPGRRPATIGPGERHIGRRGATSGD